MMRVCFPALLLLVLGCGDDDGAVRRDAGFSFRDAGRDAGCIPFYLSGADRPLDAGGEHVALSCEWNAGTPSRECSNIEWSFAGGEIVDLAGCCTPAGACGVIDPTGMLGCIDRNVFGEPSTSCTYAPDLDASADDDASDEDAAAAPI